MNNRGGARRPTKQGLLPRHQAILSELETTFLRSEILQGIANKLPAIRDLGELAQAILEGAQALVPFTDGSIGIVDRGQITFPYAIGRSAEAVMRFKTPVGEGLTGWVAQTGEAIRIDDVSEDDRYWEQIGDTRSELDVPIKLGDRVIGVINAESTQVGAFSEDDQRLLTTLADYAATAIRNAQHVKQLELFHDIANKLPAIRDLGELAQAILERAQALVPFTDGSIGIVDRGQITFPYAIGRSAEAVMQFEIQVGEGLTGRVVQTGEAIRIDDVSEDDRYWEQIGDTRSELDVPIKLGDRVIGVINAESTQVGAFSEDDQHLLTALADHAATAIRNAQHVKQLELFHDIANKLPAIRDLGELAQAILEGAQALVPFTDGSIGLVDEGVITFPYAVGRSAEAVMQFEIQVGEGLTGRVVQTGEAIRIDDVSEDDRYWEQIGDTRSELDVPIKLGDRVIGVINAESTQVGAFSEDDQYLLTTLANHAATAIRNAQLFTQANALTDIARELSSTLDYEVVLEHVLRTATELIKCPEVSVGLLGEKTNTLQFTMARGPSKLEVLDYTLGIEEGLTGWAVRNKASVRVSDVTQDPRYDKQIKSTRSELDVPMIVGGEVIGVLNAESPNLNAFSEQDQHLLEALASQAAVAIRNARVYDDINVRHAAAKILAALGSFGDNLVHRTNNWVGVALFRVQQIETAGQRIEKIAPDEDTRELGRKIQDRARKAQEPLAKTIEHFEDFAARHRRKVEPKWINVNEAIHAAIETVLIPSEIRVTEHLGEDVQRVYASEGLREVFENLIANAVEAMPNGGELRIESAHQGKEVVVRVQDSGRGIPQKDRDRIYDPGYSTKEPPKGQGMGFGLWWVKTYLTMFGGNIDMESELGVGTTFIVTLPCSKELTEAARGGRL